METLVVAHHRNHDQNRGRSRSHGSTRFVSSSPPSGSFQGTNCRTFHSREGLQWVPLNSCSPKTSVVTKKPFCSSLSPKTPSPSLNENSKTSKRIDKTSSIPMLCSLSPKTPSPSLNELPKASKRIDKISSIPMLCSSLSPKTPSPSLNENPKTLKGIDKSSSFPMPMNIMFDNYEAGFQFSELWAGPAYSNSPPPSSLPMPKFSMRPKRTVSLDLPTVASEIDFPPFSKSAPTSPRERSPSPGNLYNTDSATKTLRRIFNLDIDDA